MRFLNLSAVELGALAWLLSLPKEHFFRFGGGKPLGFGSVRLDLESHEIFGPEALRTRCTAWDTEPSESAPWPEAAKAAFEAALALWKRRRTGDDSLYRGILASLPGT